MKYVLLKRLMPYLTFEMKLFYNSYMLSQIDYCCVVWANGSSSSINKVVKMQKKSARTILQKSYDTPSSQLFTQLKWMSFKNRCNYHTGVLVYKALNHLTPSYITELLESASFNFIRLRSSYQYKLIKPLQKIRKQTICLALFRNEAETFGTVFL